MKLTEQKCYCIVLRPNIVGSSMERVPLVSLTSQFKWDVACIPLSMFCIRLRDGREFEQMHGVVVKGFALVR